MREIIALTAEPLFARVYKWKSAMAQYTVGHLDRLQRIESLRQQLPDLALAGNGYSGIGVPDCVRSGTEAAAKVLAEMGWGIRLAVAPRTGRNQSCHTNYCVMSLPRFLLRETTELRQG